MFSAITNLFKTKSEELGTYILSEPVPVQFIKLLNEKRYNELENFFFKQDSKNRYILCSDIGQTGDFQTQIQDWHNRHQTALSNTFMGALHTFLAWEERSGARADEVSEEQFEGFRKYLHKSLEYFETAINIDSELAEAYSFSIPTLMGLSVDLDVIIDKFEKAIALDPINTKAYMATAGALNPKWLGDEHLFAEFVATTQANCKDTEIVTIIENYYLAESWLFLGFYDETEHLQQTYYQEKETINRIKESYNKYRFLNTIISPMVVSYLGFNLYMAGMEDKAQLIMSKTKDKQTLMPWGYLGVTTVKEVRKLGLY